jgi:hypothetical protein
VQAIEPISFEIEGSGLDLPDFQARLSSPQSGWGETHDFLIHKALEKDFTEISQQSVKESYEEVMDEEFEPVNEVAPWLKEEIISYRYPPIHIFTPIYYMNGVLCMPNLLEEGVIYLLSNNKEKLRERRDAVVESLNRSPKIYGELGLESVTVDSGQDFTLNMLRKIEQVDSVEVGEPDDFENQIYRDLEPISEAFVHNVTVSFDSPQEPEYDILFSLSPSNTISIEVEDHSGTESVPGESDLIDGPSGESDFINASKVFSICKGVSSERIGELRLKSELTNVDIIEREQCSDRVRKYITEEMLPNLISPRGSRRM